MKMKGKEERQEASRSKEKCRRLRKRCRRREMEEGEMEGHRRGGEEMEKEFVPRNKSHAHVNKKKSNNLITWTSFL